MHSALLSLLSQSPRIVIVTGGAPNGSLFSGGMPWMERGLLAHVYEGAEWNVCSVGCTGSGSQANLELWSAVCFRRPVCQPESPWDARAFCLSGTASAAV